MTKKNRKTYKLIPKKEDIIKTQITSLYCIFYETNHNLSLFFFIIIKKNHHHKLLPFLVIFGTHTFRKFSTKRMCFDNEIVMYRIIIILTIRIRIRIIRINITIKCDDCVEFCTDTRAHIFFHHVKEFVCSEFTEIGHFQTKCFCGNKQTRIFLIKSN